MRTCSEYIKAEDKATLRAISAVLVRAYTAELAGPSWALCVSGSKNGEKRVFFDFFSMTLLT